MKKSVLIPLLLIFTVCCKTVSVKDEKYKMSGDSPELGHIGHATSRFNTKNTFSTRAIPVLENKIRLNIEILPFTEELSDVYKNKALTNQALSKMVYTDSLATKPEFVKISILDLTALSNEINAPYNKNIFTYLQDTKKAVLVTGIAVLLPNEDIAKLRQADAYYLTNTQEKKYTIVLYKQGKKTDYVDTQGGTQLAYSLSRFCWAVNDKEQWYVGDIVKDNQGCKGNTRKRIKEKEQENLFKM